MKKKDKKSLIIRNSTAEFLIFSSQAREKGIEVRYEDENLWLTQKMMGELFQVTPQNITIHLQAIYQEGELSEEATCKEFLQVQMEGQREISRQLKFYNLDAVISIGYRVNSKRATEFRQWATRVLKEFAQKGFVLDRKRLENGAFLGEDYYEHLLEEIREIRLSERRFYQKVTDIYSTAVDYNVESETTQEFFKKVQNKLHYAIHGQTAAEVIYERASHEKPHMGLSTWENSPSGKILKSDVVIAKNYLNKDEVDALGKIVNGYLDFAEDMAKRKIPMTMNDWANHLNDILKINRRNILTHAGKISAKVAKEHAETEFEKYRVIQDRLFESDFDKLCSVTTQVVKNHNTKALPDNSKKASKKANPRRKK